MVAERVGGCQRHGKTRLPQAPPPPAPASRGCPPARRAVCTAGHGVTTSLPSQGRWPAGPEGRHVSHRQTSPLAGEMARRARGAARRGKTRLPQAPPPPAPASRGCPPARRAVCTAGHGEIDGLCRHGRLDWSSLHSTIAFSAGGAISRWASCGLSSCSHSSGPLSQAGAAASWRGVCTPPAPAGGLSSGPLRTDCRWTTSPISCRPATVRYGSAPMAGSPVLTGCPSMCSGTVISMRSLPTGSMTWRWLPTARSGWPVSPTISSDTGTGISGPGVSRRLGRRRFPCCGALVRPSTWPMRSSGASRTLARWPLTLANSWDSRC